MQIISDERVKLGNEREERKDLESRIQDKSLPDGMIALGCRRDKSKKVAGGCCSWQEVHRQQLGNGQTWQRQKVFAKTEQAMPALVMEKRRKASGGRKQTTAKRIQL